MSALKTTTAREWLIMVSCGSMIVAGLVLKINWKIFGRSAAHLLRLLRSVAHGVSPPFGRRRSTGKPSKRFHRCKPPWWYIMVHPNLVSSNTWEIIHVYYIIWYYKSETAKSSEELKRARLRDLGLPESMKYLFSGIIMWWYVMIL